VGTETLTTGGHFLGTVDYMAPEQFRPGSEDARADVYALACVLFAALTGTPPFLRETVPATMLAHLHDPPPRASDTPGVAREFDRVLARALAKSPEDRYPSAGDFGRAALAIAEGRSVTEAERSVARGAAAPTRTRLWAEEPVVEPEPEPAPVKTYRSRPRRMWGWLAAAAALAVAALAVAALPGGGSAVPPPGAPVTQAEVARLANSFAAAYADEDAARISRLLTSDAQRVSPANRQSGRSAVVAAYKSQFAGQTTTGFELTGLKATGGTAGRATARYRASYSGGADTTGTMTWDVVRERGKPRIALILARPD
jgi:ketosteroid isomerase-like protein